jgi:hypothetical protein
MWCMESGEYTVYSAQMFMRILKEAGLPDGVINLILLMDHDRRVCFNHRDFAAYILQDQPVYLIICGKRSGRICQCTDPIRVCG